MTDEERIRWDLELQKIRQEITASQAAVDKTRQETEKIAREVHWYPLVVGSGATLAIVAIVKLFL